MRIGQFGAVGQPAAPSKKFDFTGIKVLIALPTRGTCSMHFASSLAAACCFLNNAKVDIHIVKGENSCFVDMSRNKLIARFMESDCTHIWMCDDDMGFNPDAVLRMIAKDREFIAGVGNLKSDEGKDFACKIKTHADETPIVDDKGLIAATHVGGAFILMKRSVIEKMIAAYPEMKCSIVDDRAGYRFYESEYGMNSWITEDYNFCERWTKTGGEIWLYPDISFIHTGSKDYKGNYHEFLMAQPKPGEIASDAVSVLDPRELTPTKLPEAVEAMLSRQGDPGERKNGFVSAIEKIILCSSYMERIAKEIIRIESERKVEV